MATSFSEVYDSFESSFQDKCEIPAELELVWLKKAVGRYGVEVETLPYDLNAEEFVEDLDQYVIDTLGAMMKQSYQEREVSKVNKRVSIVSKDISIDGTGSQKSAARNELMYDDSKVEQMLANQKPTAYA